MTNKPLPSPQNILVDAAHIPSWLIEQMRPQLQRLSQDIRFVVVSESCADQVRASFGNALTPRDVVLKLQSVHDYPRSLDAARIKEVERIAADYEKAFDVLYWRDISNQDRRYNHMFNTWPDILPRHPQNMGISQVQLTQCINEYFGNAIEIIDEYHIDLVLARPDRISGAVLIQVAIQWEIPHTFCMTALHRGLATWVYGSYRGDKMLRAELESIRFGGPEDFPAKEKTIDRYGSPAFSAFKRSAKFKELLAEFQVFLWDRMVFRLSDFIKGRKSARTDFRRSFLQIVNRFRTIKFFEQHALSENQIKNIGGKFIVFFLPLDPEYNTHSQARHFWHAEAIIRQFVLCLPSGYRLLLKEHAVNLGNRNPEWYDRIAELPNVSWVRFQESGIEIARLSEVVISCAGTIALEAALIPRKCIVFARDYIFNFMPNVIYASSMATLDLTLRKALEPVTDAQSTETVRMGWRVYRAIENLSFDATDTTILTGSKSNLGEVSLEKCVDILLKCYRLQLNKNL